MMATTRIFPLPPKLERNERRGEGVKMETIRRNTRGKSMKILLMVQMNRKKISCFEEVKVKLKRL